jgi:hypothetical protein
LRRADFPSFEPPTNLLVQGAADRLGCTMSQVETVALWAGLISSIAGIVLSIVAMVFAIWVNNRATDINNQMIRSLQKIESSVERVSTDTRELITAAWNKMLGDMGRDTEADSASSETPDEISSGIASEVRSELMGDDEEEEATTKIDRLERALQEYKKRLLPSFAVRPLAVDSIHLTFSHGKSTSCP